MPDNDVYREYRVTCPCGDTIYEGLSFLRAAEVAITQTDTRHLGEPNTVESREVTPWVRVV